VEEKIDQLRLEFLEALDLFRRKTFGDSIDLFGKNGWCGFWIGRHI
jgi:hypothetical protein